MIEQSCPFEPHVESAERTHAWTGQLRLHVAQCGSCQECLLAIQTVQSVANRALAVSDAAPPIQAVLLRAEFIRGQRSQKLQEMIQMAGCAGVTMLFLLGLVIARTPSFFSRWENVGADWCPGLTGLLSMGAPGVAVALVLVLVWITSAEDPISAAV